VSLTGNDPFIKYADTPAPPKEEKRQWQRCTNAGLTVDIHWDGRAIGAWVKADEVESLLERVCEKLK
jgi:hypothetical protein